MTAGASFPTFCHISEYGDDGYADLHRLLAISQPLTLWAPSSVGILGPRSQITADRFVSYVNDRVIRVHARENWLTDKKFRTEHKFPGARWNESIDGPLMSIYKNDLSEPEEHRRVLAAPPERGWEEADKFLAGHQDQIDRWNKIFRSRTRDQKLPVGIIETARRESAKASTKAEVPMLVARAILRDAFNHSEAFRSSGANVPFLLASADRQFLELIRLTSVSKSGGPPPPGLAGYDPTLTDLIHQLLEVLRHLDGWGSRQDLDGFIRGEGHLQLAAWLNTICERLKRTDARSFDREIITELREQLGAAKLSSPLREFLSQRLSLGVAGIGAVGLACSAVDLMLNPANPLAAASLTASVFALGYGAAKQFQYVPTAFDGPQWPFLYTYQSAANRRRLTNLRYILDQFRKT